MQNERYVPRPYSARARCSLVVFRVHWDRQCTIPLSRLASKSESRSGNISRLCSRPWNLVERTTRTCFQWQSAWINEIFSERYLKMRFAGFAKSPQIGALWHFWTLTKIFRWCYKALQRRYACKAILTIMWCNQNEYNEQRGTTKDWLFPFVRLEAIVSGVSVISDFPINYRLAVIGGEEGLVDDANAKILAAL